MTTGTRRIRADFTSSGELKTLRDTDVLLINQYCPTIHDQAVSGIFLRQIVEGKVVQISRLTGHQAEFSIGTNGAAWTFSPPGWKKVTVSLLLGESTSENGESWIWKVELVPLDFDNPIASAQYDIVFTQDLALAPPQVALSSEPYVCQYLAHHPKNISDVEENNWYIASRQTMTAAPLMPTLLTSMLPSAKAYFTDGMQVYTPQSRATKIPEGLLEHNWESRNYQYEISSPTLLSHSFDATQPKTIEIIQRYLADYQGELDELIDDVAAYTSRTSKPSRLPSDLTPENSPKKSILLEALPLNGANLTDSDLRSFAGNTDTLLPEFAPDGSLWSFFTPDSTHVVRGDKETQVERPHGHVLRAGADFAPKDNVLSATTYAAGIFASHIVTGNTSSNRLVTVSRHPLNLLPSQGLRLIVSKPGSGTKYLLSVPSAFSISWGQMRWRYSTELGQIEVVTYVDSQDNRIYIDAEAENQLDLSFSFTVEASMDEPTWAVTSASPNRLVIQAASNGNSVHKHYPELSYVLSGSGQWSETQTGNIDSDTLFLSTSHNTHRATLEFSSDLDSAANALSIADLEPQTTVDSFTGHLQNWHKIGGNLSFARPPKIPSTSVNFFAPQTEFGQTLTELNLLLPWYAHNALIHLLVPHGLEQYSGAAWGTRDICQGPLELLLTFGKFSVVRELLLTVFFHQQEKGSFPQWFMFDHYSSLYNDSAHGDVIIWPLFALGQYLQATGDTSILDESVPFWNHSQRSPGKNKATMRDHLAQILTYLQSNTVDNTSLPAYGEGDWDDTLQPADQSMRTNMVSGWTTALLIQAAHLISVGLTEAEPGLSRQYGDLAVEVERDYHQYLLPDGILAGYLYLEPDHEAEYILHPRDKQTGLQYRLIPMTRSIIAEIFDPAQAQKHMDLIANHLHFPDGVRLMDKFAPYQEGKTTHFLRAEQAANIGREIGLMYTHAHIRYIEALAKLGDTSAITEILRISPLGLNSRLPQAHPRQRNTYYSSSDADFADRFQASAGIEDLRAGKVGIKGGWRIYSSGPGIFLRQLVQSILGLTLRATGIVFDPVLPYSADKLEIDWIIDGVTRRIRYRFVDDATVLRICGGPSFDQLEVLEDQAISNRYRDGGRLVNYGDLEGKTSLLVEIPNNLGRIGQ